jgi:hypothetical protein
MRYLLAIDDTDNKESRGTGFRARSLASLLEEKQLASVEGISRHQLFVHPDIPYTSQNSSACLDILTDNIEAVRQTSRTFILNDSAPGSDAAVCLKKWEDIPLEVVEYGRRAKIEVLNMQTATNLADRYKIYLEGLTGEHTGIIGALAAIGLRKGENDGRFIWLSGKNLRDLEGVISIGELKRQIPLDAVYTLEERELDDETILELGNWIRPVMKHGRKILIAEKTNNNENGNWRIKSREYLKSISQ